MMQVHTGIGCTARNVPNPAASDLRLILDGDGKVIKPFCG
jgi:hypothetical protein